MDGPTFWSRVTKSDGCWPWTGARGKGGYGNAFYAGRYLNTHVLAWTLSHGMFPPKGSVVMHSCDNRICVNPLHLSLGNTVKNVADKVSKGRCPHGEGHYACRFTSDDIRAIRELSASGVSQRKIAAMFNTKQPYISQVVLKRRRANG